MEIKQYKRYTVIDYAKNMGLSKQAVYKQIKENRVKFERIGKTYLVLMPIA